MSGITTSTVPTEALASCHRARRSSPLPPQSRAEPKYGVARTRRADPPVRAGRIKTTEPQSSSSAAIPEFWNPTGIGGWSAGGGPIPTAAAGRLWARRSRWGSGRWRGRNPAGDTSGSRASCPAGAPGVGAPAGAEAVAGPAGAAHTRSHLAAIAAHAGHHDDGCGLAKVTKFRG